MLRYETQKHEMYVSNFVYDNLIIYQCTVRILKKQIKCSGNKDFFKFFKNNVKISCSKNVLKTLIDK